MNRRSFLGVCGTAIVGSMAGCIGYSNSADNPSADNYSTPGGRAITVSATGDVSGDPDKAVLSLSVETRANSAQEVRSTLADDAETLVQALEDAGIPSENITTDRFRIRERIDRQRVERDGIEHEDELTDEHRYYEGSHRYSVEVEAVDDVGEIIDIAVDAGADDVGRVTFTLSDEKRAELRDVALQEAIANARTEAEVIANEIGAEIVEVTLIDTTRGQITPVQREVFMAGDAPEPTPSPEPEAATTVEPGDVTVSVQVQIQYAIS